MRRCDRGTGGPRLAICAAALGLLAACLWPGATAGAAEPTIQTGTVEPLYESPDAGARDRWMQRTDAVGAGFVRINVFWPSVVGRKPLLPSDPDDPAYDWSRHRRRGRRAPTSIGFASSSPSTGRPAGLTPPDVPPDVRPEAWKPSPEDFGHFARALAKRYSVGPQPGVPLPIGGGQSPPPTRWYEIWNEPNLTTYLAPQWVGTQGLLTGHLLPPPERRLLEHQGGRPERAGDQRRNRALRRGPRGPADAPGHVPAQPLLRPGRAAVRGDAAHGHHRRAPDRSPPPPGPQRAQPARRRRRPTSGAIQNVVAAAQRAHHVVAPPPHAALGDRVLVGDRPPGQDLGRLADQAGRVHRERALQLLVSARAGGDQPPDARLQEHSRTIRSRATRPASSTSAASASRPTPPSGFRSWRDH